MTNETTKVLLILVLFGGLRAAIFATDIGTARIGMRCRQFFDWMMPLVWPARSHHHRHA
ncbi:MAG TPA: hypothetical protein VFL62_21280 [Bradyrhizobium sp.]|uniref:hypothetical protein n=1 Tax=Bradyrhizobium sp. TaxID=376 RepID=UPI002D7F8B63|nr:hypothetical protein [Bradyrhizobium sp.]HET7888765.1 hypothetical protein [Bradyrhizobium sp.]